MTNVINSGLLRVARQRKGFSQGEAAERFSVPQAALSRYENGIAVPSEEFISKAALVYDLPASFFYQTDAVMGPPVSVHAVWRKKADVTAREMDKIIAEINIRGMHLRRLFEAVEFTPQSSIPKLDPDDFDGDIERIAGLVRAHWLLPPGPVQNLTDAVEKAGAVVVHSPLGESSVSGVTVSMPGLPPIILLNSEQPADRARFTLAHEIGHIVMHRFPNADMEQQANDFASALLMPPQEIKIALSGRVDLRRVAALKPEWKVSMQSLVYRAQQLALINRNQAVYLWKQFNYTKIKMREPVELDFPHEIPGVLSRMVRLHLDNFGYSLLDLAKLLHMHDHQLEQYYNVTGPEKLVTGLRLRVVK